MGEQGTSLLCEIGTALSPDYLLRFIGGLPKIHKNGLGAGRFKPSPKAG